MTTEPTHLSASRVTLLESAERAALPAARASFPWLKSLLAAAIAGASSSVLSSGGSAFVGSPLNWKQTLACALVAAVHGAAFYLKQSPLPGVAAPAADQAPK